MAAWSILRLWCSLQKCPSLANSSTVLARCCSQEVQVKPTEDIIKKRKAKKRFSRAEIDQYLNSSGLFGGAINEIPTKYININKLPPESLLLVNHEVANTVVDKIKNFLPNENSSVPVLEANPGLGLVTENLLTAGVKHLRLYEPSVLFHNRLQDLIQKYPDRKVDLRSEDLANIVKLIFFDKIDSGNRVQQLMTDIPTRPWSDPEPLVKVIEMVPNKKNIKELIFSIAFQNGIAAYGRPEYFLVMHPYNYVQLTCNRQDGYNIYRYNSALFQIMYKSSLLAKLPRQAFLPWEYKYVHKKSNNKVQKLKGIDPEYMYLVHAEARPELMEQLRPDQLQQLWYFVRLHFVSRKNKIIPALERWIPNCGPRLIRQGLSIFTEFGDLDSAQMLRLFQLFTSWPEFPDCPFQASMETSFLKNDPAIELEKEGEGDIEDAEPEPVPPPPSLT